MEDNFKGSVVYGLIHQVKEMNHLEKDMDRLIDKVEDMSKEEIKRELKSIKYKIWGLE